MTETRSPRGCWRLLAALVLIALAVRGGVLWALHADLQKDPDGYAEIAQGLTRTGIFGRPPPHAPGRTSQELQPTAYRPPAYPLLLANFVHAGKVSPLPVALLHLGLGAATVLLTFALARMWELPPAAAFFAGLLVACDPILLRQSALVMTETLAAFLAVVALAALTRFSRRPTAWDAALAGGAMALCALCRPTFYVWLALAAVAAAPSAKGSVRRAVNVLAILGAAAVVISPWAIRNQFALGRPIISTTHGGYTLALGNNRLYYEHLRTGSWGTVWADNGRIESWIRDECIKGPFGLLFHHEIDLNRAGYRVALQSIRNEPGIFAWSCLVRIAWLWSPLPQRIDEHESTATTLLRCAAAAWYAAVFALAIVGAATLRRKLFRTPWLWGVLLCLAFTAVHTFYWTNLRMRAPLMPVVALAAAAGAMAIARRWQRALPAPTM